MEEHVKIEELYEKRDSAIEKVRNSKTINELDVAELELRKAELEIRNFKQSNEAVEKAPPEAREERSSEAAEKFSPIASFRTSVQDTEYNEDDIYGSLEYRKAFKDYIINGLPIPEKFTEKRTAEITTVADVAAVIPTTILNQVIEDLTVEGKILSRVTQTSYQGGVQIPISEINPTAAWIAGGGAVSEEQKAEMKAKIAFAYHTLEARVAIDLLSKTVSLPVFEATVVKQLKKSMTKAIEASIVSGTGSGQPLGFTKYDLPKENIVEMNEETIGMVSAWAGVEAAIPEAYEDSVIYLMSKATWEKYLNGMTDKNGQRIGLGKINEKGQKILNGREVLITDKLPSFMTASEGDIFAVVVDLSKYCLNSNLAMYYRKYFDEDKNKWIHKALMIVDGKMAIGEVGDSPKKFVGAGGLIYIKKKADLGV